MLGLLKTLIRSQGLLPFVDGDWILMTSEDWDELGSINWQNWDGKADWILMTSEDWADVGSTNWQNWEQTVDS